jgi:ATP diphosphatase
MPPPDEDGGKSRETLEALERLDSITRRLRVECPWDREQDERSIVPHTVEEAYELADAAARGDDAKLLDELGDVLFQVVFLSLLLEEREAGDLRRVAEGISAKLIRRHPHVFGSESGEAAAQIARETQPDTAARVLGNWDRIKREVEGRGEGEPFGDLPDNLPALLYASKILRRTEPDAGSPPPRDSEARDAAEVEVGEALLDAVRRARRLGVDPELALRGAADRHRDAAS